MNVIFDMETGDPDDLITLIMLLINPDVELKGITCYQGSPIQIGLINHVLQLANKDIPVGGWNSAEPASLSPYYTSVVGAWSPANAQYTPVQVFDMVHTPDTHVLTGAPLTNLKMVLEQLPECQINNMTTQGGYLGYLVQETLPKFQKVQSIRTYNLSNDTAAFDAVNKSNKIHNLTFVTKDLCHGFMYDATIHEQVNFGNSSLEQLLKKCFAHYVNSGKAKAMHDPLAMLYMLYPEIGDTTSVDMSYSINSKGHALFSSQADDSNRFGLTGYDKTFAWNKFIEICSAKPVKKLKY